MAKSSDVRERLRAAGESQAEKIEAFFVEALDAQKELWVTCGKCQRKTQVVVPDWHARTKAVESLLDRGYGRPRQEEAAEAGVTIVVHRNTPSLDPRREEEVRDLLGDEDYAKMAEGLELHASANRVLTDRRKAEAAKSR